MKYKKGQLVQVEIADAGEDNTCFGRIDGGLAVFVQGTVAVGDRVEAEIRKIKRNHLQAQLVQVVSPSPSRVSPVCSHFGLCGGCKWQHVDYEEQRRIKRKQIQDVLEHVGGFSGIEVEPVIPAASPLRYRNKVDFTFSGRRYLLPDEMDLEPEDLGKPLDYALGFHAPRRFGKVIDIDECHLAPPEMSRVLDVVKGFGRERGLSVYSTHTHEGFLRNLVVRCGVHTDEWMVYLITSSFDPDLMQALRTELVSALGDRLTTFVNGVTDRKNLVAYADEQHVIQGPGSIRDTLGSFTFSISPNTFFQTNTRQAERLYKEVVKMADPGADDLVYDLYCGAGSISLFLAAQCRKVLGIEAVASAVADAADNAARNQVSNCEFKLLDLRELSSIREDLEAFGLPRVVVTDPPRAGMHPKAVRGILDLEPERIVYVCCKPVSLARDAALLCETGRYRLERVVPVDMFPQTYHVECVALLQRIDA